MLLSEMFQGDFREENFNTAMGVLKDAGDASKGDQRGRKGGSKSEYRLELSPHVWLRMMIG